MCAEMAPSSSTSGASFLRSSMASIRTGSISRRVRSASVSVNNLGSGASCSFSSSAIVCRYRRQPRKRQERPRARSRSWLSIFAYAELHCQSHTPEISRASDELNGDAEDRNAPGEAHARRLAQPFLGLFTASHTFDALNHFIAHTFFPRAVKLTSLGGCGQWHLLAQSVKTSMTRRARACALPAAVRYLASMKSIT